MGLGRNRCGQICHCVPNGCVAIVFSQVDGQPVQLSAAWCFTSVRRVWGCVRSAVWARRRTRRRRWHRCSHCAAIIEQRPRVESAHRHRCPPRFASPLTDLHSPVGPSSSPQSASQLVVPTAARGPIWIWCAQKLQVVHSLSTTIPWWHIPRAGDIKDSWRIAQQRLPATAPVGWYWRRVATAPSTRGGRSRLACRCAYGRRCPWSTFDYFCAASPARSWTQRPPCWQLLDDSARGRGCAAGAGRL